MKKIILFDLDGTLIDSAEGITKSMQYALGKMNIHIEDLKSLEVFIGPPIVSTAMELFGMTEEEGQLVRSHYRDRFHVSGILEHELYEGIPEILATLKEKGYELGVATSKPEAYAIQILDSYNLSHFFTYIAGNTMEDSRPSKSHVIGYALEKLGREDNDFVTMVGDRKFDIEGAKAQGIYGIGVTYGFGSVEELTTAGADQIVRSTHELESFLITQ